MFFLGLWTTTFSDRSFLSEVSKLVYRQSLCPFPLGSREVFDPTMVFLMTSLGIKAPNSVFAARKITPSRFTDPTLFTNH